MSASLVARLDRLELAEREARRRRHAERAARRMGCNVDDLLREADALEAEITAALGPNPTLETAIAWLAESRGLDPVELRATAERVAEQGDG